jgi:hypothetical protein
MKDVLDGLVRGHILRVFFESFFLLRSGHESLN